MRCDCKSFSKKREKWLTVTLYAPQQTIATLNVNVSRYVVITLDFIRKKKTLEA